MTPIKRVTCAAPQPDPRRTGDPCGTFLGYREDDLEFITTAEKARAEPDGSVWIPHTRRNCGQWNWFRIVAANAP